jgi:peptide/nickel transport system permease protein
VRYLLRRLLLLLPTLWGVATAVFLVLRVVPGDPAIQLVGDLAQKQNIEAIRRQLGLDQPLIVQYGDYLARLVTGDLGMSFQTRQSVAGEIGARLAATLQLASVATLVIIGGIPLGVIGGRRYRSLLDHAVMLVGTVGLSLPSFWIALVLIWLFSVRLGLLPVGGRDGWASLIMPAVSLSIGSMAVMARTTRTGIVEVMGQNYIQAARARGLSERRIVFWHALRNALIPAVTLVGLNFGSVLANAVVVETIFSWPGMGSLLFQALQYRDFPVIQGVTVVLATLFLLINFAVDMVYMLLDPRIRYA